LEQVALAVQENDGGKMLDIVQELEASGQSLQHFSRELSRYWRNLLVAKLSGGRATSLIAASDHEQSRLISITQRFSEEDLTRYLNLSLNLYQDLQSSLQPRLHLELGLIKLVQASRIQAIESALMQLDSESKADVKSTRSAEVRSPVTQMPKVAPAATKPTSRTPSVQAAEPGPASSNETRPASGPGADLKATLYAALLQAGLDFTADAVLAAELSLQNTELLIRVPKKLLLSLQESKLQTIASEVIGKRVSIRLEAGSVQQDAPSKEDKITPAEGSDLRERALSHPGVKRFQELFPDAQVRTVRNLNE
jgi:DNA polymerase-3 subunit gamma/tau